MGRNSDGRRSVSQRFRQIAKDENLMDFAKKWLSGIIIISVVGVLSFAFLFALMLVL